jgi:predicted Rossmann fold nucleotide-binding protein DprA/Smf involved in DNA uptake
MSNSLAPYQISPDTQAALLLCGSLGLARAVEPRPLTLAEYNRLGHALHAQGSRPSDLFAPGGLALVETTETGIDRERLHALLGRGAALALAVEAWTSRGLWVLGRADERYPSRLRSRLKGSAPALLYGVGEPRLLDEGGLAIVGSRDADAAATSFTEEIAGRCAVAGLTVISGGARGIDAMAMETALERGGRVVGVLADRLARAAVSKPYRGALRAGRLALWSPYDPDAGFSVGNAMGRNRHIYALSDAALVVSATEAAGGTWAGAVENLKRQWVPLYVRSGEQAPPGNRLLVDQGGRPVSSTSLPTPACLIDWTRRHDDTVSKGMPLEAALVPTQLTLLAGPAAPARGTASD